MQVVDELRDISNGIGNFIKAWLLDRNDFECRSFYGQTFSLALLSLSNNLDRSTKGKLISSYDSMDKSDSQFHWEFNNYALLEYYKSSRDEEILKFLEPLKFKNTPCTNWTLLRSNARLLANKDKNLAIKEARKKITMFQLQSGLILDDKNVKSFQYHCFSAAMIGEIYEQTKMKEFYDSFIKAVDFIKKFILSNGDTLYIGRGQKQSFGYGALIYILSLAYKHTSNNEYLGYLESVLKYLTKYKNEDNSFPLVINGVKQDIPKCINIKDTNYAGWYPYNNYFDYLPFMGFFIAKSIKVLQGLKFGDININNNESYSDENFIKVVTKKYEAVVSRSGGYWTNDMPIPYIVSNKDNITPCYGGEQFQKSIYTMKGIPIPYCNRFKKSIRWKSFSILKNNTLWIISPLGIMKRKYKFTEDSIEIDTKTYSLLKFSNTYLFKDYTVEKNSCEFSVKDVKVVSKNELKFYGFEYSADGKLKLYYDGEKNSTIKFIF